ncbi:hypothetical protein BKG84_24555 [Mycobacteroides chelonae]|uniref:Uncharacterized protein n=2 Tax=Mycobacteroides chelonae TaxID=1774 RepID=A0A1S1LUN8_MYCCH|nr:hypothetical protein BKG84_24555 [Mycobacteroides chelonae]
MAPLFLVGEGIMPDSTQLKWYYATEPNPADRHLKLDLAAAGISVGVGVVSSVLASTLILAISSVLESHSRPARKALAS